MTRNIDINLKLVRMVLNQPKQKDKRYSKRPLLSGIPARKDEASIFGLLDKSNKDLLPKF